MSQANSKIKILFVDDEQIMREGLQLTIDWEAYGFEVMGSASNGEKALMLCENTTPDIVITDIRMPVIDGLELTKKLIERNPDVKIIILSAYDDFKYAQKALAYGACEYILKAELECEDLLALSLKLCEKILTEREKQHHSEDMIQKIRTHASELQENLLWALLTKNCYPQVIKHQMQDLGIALMPESLLLLHLKFISSTSVSSEMELLPGILFSSYYWVKSSPSHLILMGNADAQKVDGFSLDSMMQNLHGLLLEQAACDFVLLYTPLFSGYQEIFNHNKIILEYLRLYSFYNPKSKCHCVKTGFVFAQTNFSAALLDFMKQTHLNQLDHAKSIIKEMFADFRKNIYSPDDLKETTFVLCTIAEEKAKQLHILYCNTAGHITESFTDGLDLKQRIYSFKQLDHMIEQTSGYLMHLLTFISEHLYRYNSIVTKAIQYISQHMSEEITLNIIAKEIYCSPIYLSQIFKKETQQNFSDYLTKARIQLAQLLLTTTGMSIGEIAEMVGIPNPSYFSKVFIKFTGTQPNKYRSKQM